MEYKRLESEQSKLMINKNKLAKTKEDLNSSLYECSITQSYTMEEMDVWGLVGSATANGWDGPNDKFMPDFGINEGYYYLTGAVLADGEIKVRQNDAWGVNYGDDGNDGTLELNGANIPVSAGTYNITLNLAANPPTIAIHQW